MRFDDVPLLDVLRVCFGNPGEVWGRIVQLVFRMARTRTHGSTVGSSHEKKTLNCVESGRGANNTTSTYCCISITLRITIRYVRKLSIGDFYFSNDGNTKVTGFGSG